jgi:hypothetical protein
MPLNKRYCSGLSCAARQMKRWSALLGLAICSACFSQTVPDTCAKLPPSTVTVNLHEPEIQTNYQYKAATLKSMSNRYGEHQVVVLGLTKGQALANAKVGVQLIRNAASGWECATHQVVIDIGYQPITIYVGREFPEGSCAFKEIFAHEMLHAEVFRKHARAMASEIETALRQRFIGAAPTRGPIGSTRETIEKELNERWLPYIRRLLAQAEALQRPIDTPEESEKVVKACKAQMNAFMAGTK